MDDEYKYDGENAEKDENAEKTDNVNGNENAEYNSGSYGYTRVPPQNSGSGSYQPDNGGAPYGNNSDNPNSYEGNQYSQNQYGNYYQNQYGQSQYGQGSFSDYNSDNGKPPKKKNTGMKVFVGLVAIIVIAAIAAVVGIFVRSGGENGGKISVSTPENSSTAENVNIGSLDAKDSSLTAGEAADVAKKAKKYNVGILIYQNDKLYTEGSGVAVKEDESGKYTYIITCAHVINYNNAAVSVLTEDGTEYAADVVGMDQRTDIGVVRIEASGLNLAEFADSDKLIVGQTVYAVGNPGGSEFFGSVTNGIISAIDRPISSGTGYQMECIQHTSAINPGNSGGALVNGEGKVIGINSMKIASTEYEGMGFSVPSNVVIDVFNSIVKNGYVAGRAKLGISYTSPSNYSQTYAMYVQMKGLPSGTIVIAEVNEDSAFKDKDVREGDMITKVNGKDMSDTGMLSSMIEGMSVGDKLTLTIVPVNTDNWSQTEQNITVALVEDKGTTVQQDAETTTSSQQNPFGNGSAEDFYEYYKKFFGY